MTRLARRLPVVAFLAATLLAPFCAHAQTSAADSARAFAAMPDTMQVLTLNAQAWAIRRSDPTLAIAIAQRSLEMARRIGFRRAEAQVLNYLGVGYQWLGDNRQASGFYFQALAVADSVGAVVEQGYALNNIASLLLLEGDGEQALSYSMRALALQETTHNQRGIAYAHIRMAEIENRLARHDEAIAHAQASLEIWKQLGEGSTGLSARRSMAIGYEGKHEYREALAQLLAIDASDSLPAATRLHNYTDLARLYLRVDQPQKAIDIGLRKLAAGDPDADVLGHLAEAYARQRDWATAYAYAKRETAVRDSLAKQERFRQLKNLQLIHETSQKEQENRALRAGLRLTRYLAAAIGAILLLTGFLVVTGFVHRKRQGQVNRTLNEQLARIRASESALSESWRRQRAILENVPDAMWVTDCEGRYTAVNAAFSRRFGRPKEDLEGRTVEEILDAAAVPALREQVARVVESRQTQREEHEIVANGVHLVVERTLSPMLDAENTVIGTTGISRDITGRRRAEAQVRHAQKLESLSVLAGGIAHDFNNLLVAILGNAEIARMDIAPGSVVLESLDEIETSARRAAELTRQMLDYTGKSQIFMRDLDLSAVIGQHSPDIDAVIPGTATLRMDLAPHLPRVTADTAQITQVVMSLVTNAAESLVDGEGTITVKTALEHIRAGGGAAARHHVHEAHTPLHEGEYVVIEVSDTGHGMSAETRRRIFEPFFSTRFLGRGLSLAAVQGILRGHSGTIEVESEVGLGSRFRVYFPVHGHAIRTAADAVATEVSVPA